MRINGVPYKKEENGKSGDLFLVETGVLAFAGTLLVWGLSVQVSRYLGLSLKQCGAIGGFAIISLIGIIVFHVVRHGKRFQFPKITLLLLFLLCLACGIWRSQFELKGSDAQVYYSAPAYHLAHPDVPMNFGWSGYYEATDEQYSSYMLPYTYEYLPVYVAFLADRNVPEIAFKFFPSFLFSLFPFVLYGLVRLFSSSPSFSLLLTSLAVIFVLFDTTHTTSFGGMIFERVYENKGLLVGIGLPSLSFVFLSAFKYRNSKYLYLLFILSSGLSLTGMNAPILSISVAFTMCLSAIVSDYICNVRKINLYFVCKAIFYSTIFPFFVIACVYLSKESSVYEFAHQVHAVWGKFHFDNSFSEIYLTVMKNYGLFDLLSLLLLVLFYLIIVYVRIRDSWIDIYFISWLSIYILLFFTPVFYLLVRFLSPYESISFFRFYYTFPIYALIPLLAALTYKEVRFQPTLLKIFYILLALNVSAVVIDKSKEAEQRLGVNLNRKYVSNQEMFLLDWGLLNTTERENDLILAPAFAALDIATHSPGGILMAGKGYWLRERKFEHGNAMDIVKAQAHISKRHKDFPGAFEAVISHYDPSIIVVHESAIKNVETVQVLSMYGYVRQYARGEYKVYLKPAGRIVE